MPLLVRRRPGDLSRCAIVSVLFGLASALGGGCGSSGDDASTDAGSPPDASADASADADADTGTSGVLVPTGQFAIVYEEGAARLAVYAVSKDEATGALVPVKDAPPVSGGFRASAPGDVATTGCPGSGTLCGTLALENLEPKLRRNVFAVVTHMSPGWNPEGDDPRGLALPGAIAYVDYEHVPAGSKAAARTWSFRGGVGSFQAIVQLYSSDVECTKTGVEDPRAAPDVDADCDGVPGVSRASALFVDPTFGDDGAGDGSIRAPFKTVHRAAASVDATHGTLVLAAGTHDGALASPPNHRLDVSKVHAILGGYDGARGFAERSLADTIVVQPPDPTSRDAHGLVRADGAVDLFLQRLVVRAVGGDATESSPAGSAYALDLRAGAGTVTLDGVAVVAIGGRGLPGKAGAPGVAGAPGAPGGATGPGTGGAGKACPLGGTSGRGGDGGAGGALAGDETTGAGANGQDGGDAVPTVPKPLAPGGSGAGASDTCVAPFGSRVGQTAPATGWDAKGANGPNATLSGKADLQLAWFSGDRYVIDGASQNGFAAGHGTPGGGGAGGGGGGACETARGGNAGGGGAGGCGGQGGLGGTAGGGAFAIWSLSTSVVFTGSVTLSATGGAGGAGGAPGPGGLGGVGGAGESIVERDGGAGSRGAPGGAGGVASGANGGPAACVAQKTGGPVPTAGFSCTAAGGAAGGAPLFELRGKPGASIEALVY